ncbi:hypothetical protein MKW92_020285 [Papaver armeniacum]|nr:hypothetical protein MKW92_020285 [Papaver armeniacum]
MVEHLKAKSNVVDATVSMSEMDIAEKKFADNSHRLTGDKEIPLKFLDTVLSDWKFRQDDIPMQSKIKCTVNGIAGFHFENRTEYEFLLYVADGSCETKVRIDHKIVEAQIGYSPKQLSDALSYPGKDVADKINKKAAAVVETMFGDFEGTMFVAMNKNSAFPVALGWIDDATASDLSRFVEACEKRLLAVSP